MFCPHCIYVFCIYLRTNSDLCHLQHKQIGFHNQDEKCLQRGTEWVFNPLNAELNPICHLLILLANLTFMGTCIVSIFQYTVYSARCNVTQFIYVWKLLYMFRVVLPPIIRSAYNCIYSIWYLSQLYCYLPLSWKSWNRFE
jgi:hypothetical protein